jgi:hypothetical protein
MPDAVAHHTVRYSTYESKNGLKLTASPSDWLCALLACYEPGSRDCTTSLIHHRASLIHHVGNEDESVEVWKLPNDEFVTFHLAENRPAACTVCPDTVSFLLFHSLIMGRISMRLLSEQRYAAWAERQLCERARERA